MTRGWEIESALSRLPAHQQQHLEPMASPITTSIDPLDAHLPYLASAKESNSELMVHRIEPLDAHLPYLTSTKEPDSELVVHQIEPFHAHLPYSANTKEPTSELVVHRIEPFHAHLPFLAGTKEPNSDLEKPFEERFYSVFFPVGVEHPLVHLALFYDVSTKCSIITKKQENYHS